MARTVVGLVDNLEKAQHVLHDLVASGIHPDEIGFRANEPHAVPSSAALNESEGGDDLQRERVAVAVAVQTEDQAHGAVQIMKRHGAMDIDQQPADER